MSRQKPISFKIQKSKEHALLVQVDDLPYFYDSLHYHPEFQITAIEKGEGIFYGGNHVSTFKEGDVFLIGSNVPHLFKCSEQYYAEDSTGVRSISLFFDYFSFGRDFFELKEMANFKILLEDSRRIIHIKRELKTSLFERILSSPNLKNEKSILNFLDILSLSSSAEKVYLNDEQYHLTLNQKQKGRLHQVMDYTFKHFRQEINIDTIAEVAALSRSQFSAFFKLHTNKTYIEFLNELRIEHACLLLRDDNLTVEQVCYEVGFQNMSNFTRHFKRLKSINPSAYRKKWSI